MEKVVVTEEADSILCKEDKLQAVWMCAALEVMRIYNLEKLSLGWAFNFRDCDVRDVFIEYILESHDRIILEFRRRYLTFGFEVRYTGGAIDKADLEKFKEAINNRYELDSLKVDLIISYMEVDILKKQESELELEKKKEDQSDWIDCFCDYGFSNIPINKLAGMKIEDDPVGVYVLRDIDNEKRYVGQGKKVISRALKHFTDAVDDSVSEAYKAGHRFVVERIITGYKDGADFCLNRVEADLIEYYDSVNCGYNRTKGNTRATGYNGVKLARKDGDVK